MVPVILDHPEAGLGLRGSGLDNPGPGSREPADRRSPGPDMQAVILTIHLLLALALILVVLLQRSEGGGLGIGGGGGMMTSRGAATALSKVTWAIGIAFVATSLTLTIIAARETSAGSVIDAAHRNLAAPRRRRARGAGARGRPLAAAAGPEARGARRRPGGAAAGAVARFPAGAATSGCRPGFHASCRSCFAAARVRV